MSFPGRPQLIYPTTPVILSALSLENIHISLKTFKLLNLKMLFCLSFWCGALCFVNVLWWSEAMDCQGTARYRLTFLAEWTSQSHRDFPSCCFPHFSNLIGCSHNASYVMWTPGILATPGVKNVAELGKYIYIYCLY